MPILPRLVGLFLTCLIAGGASAQLAIDDKLVEAGGVGPPSWISLDGGTLVVTERFGDRLMVYERTALGWELAQEIFPPEGLFSGLPTRLITRGIVSGGLIAAIVGSEQDPVTGEQQVAAVFYSNLGGTWVLVDTLSDVSVLDLSGSTMVAAQSGSPAMHFYERSGGAWSETGSISSPVGGGGQWSILKVRGDTAIGRADIDPDDIANDTIALYEVRNIGGTWSVVAPFAIPDGNPSGGSLGPNDIGDDYLVIGAPFTSGNGPNNEGIGAAYVFARTALDDWVFLQKLQPRDLNANDTFGFQVEVDGDRILVSARGDDEAAPNAGAVYVFERAGTEFIQATKLVPSDGGDTDRYGRLIELSGDRAAVLSDNGPAGAVYTYGCGPDSDGDGLCDDWETMGVPYLDSNGDVQRYLLDIDGDALSDADPGVIDLFVELDVMTGVPFGATEVGLLENAFANAPVLSPQGFPGITLHIDVQQDVFSFEQISDSVDGIPNNPQARERLNFGTFQEAIDPESEAILNAKAKAFRYGVAFNDVRITTEGNINIGGQAELPGDDFVIYLTTFTTPEDRAAVFMHELGHTLGLRHGGGDDINGKPNYPSIMNYSIGTRAGWNTAFWQLDYSREKLATLNEASLDESTPVGTGSSGYYDSWQMPVSVIVPDQSGCAPPSLWNQRVRAFVPLASMGCVDWAVNCGCDDTGVMQDLNFLDQDQLSNNPADTSPGETMVGFNDWANLRYPISDGGGAFRGPLALGEPTIALIEEIRNLPPPEDCAADVTTTGATLAGQPGFGSPDGVADLDDLGYYLNLWIPGDPAADLTSTGATLEGQAGFGVPDGTVDLDDLGYFLNAWLAGCP